jgi:hypothetical protein
MLAGKDLIKYRKAQPEGCYGSGEFIFELLYIQPNQNQINVRKVWIKADSYKAAALTVAGIYHFIYKSMNHIKEGGYDGYKVVLKVNGRISPDLYLAKISKA